MKKNLRKAALMLILLSFTLAACGREKTETHAGTEHTEQGAEQDTELVSEGSEHSESLEPQKAVWREKVEEAGFTVICPENWMYEEEDRSSYSIDTSAKFFVGESPERCNEKVCIWAAVGSANEFRLKAYRNGLSLQEYAAGEGEKRSFGGMELTLCPGWNTEKSVLLGRDEKSGITASIEVYGNLDGEDVQALLQGLTIHLEDQGRQDPPYPWEGKPFVPEIRTQTVGSFTIDAQYIPFQEPQAVAEDKAFRFVVQDDRLHLLNRRMLTSFLLQNDMLVEEAQLQLTEERRYLSSDHQGVLYASQGNSSVLVVRNQEEQTAGAEVQDELSMHPSGEWGISSYVGNDPQKITNQNGELHAAPWVLTNLHSEQKRQGIFRTLDGVFITDSHILVAGVARQDDGLQTKKIAVYDYDGKLKLMLDEPGRDSDADMLSSYIAGMAETAHGFAAADALNGRIDFWDRDGAFIGSINAGEMQDIRAAAPQRGHRFHQCGGDAGRAQTVAGGYADGGGRLPPAPGDAGER